LRSVTPAPADRREGLWTLNWPGDGGHYCFDARVGMIIKRAPQNAGVAYPAASFKFAESTARYSEIGNVAAGQAYFLWPDAALPTPGHDASYRLTSGKISQTVKLTAVPVRDLDPLALAEFLTSRKCDFPLSMFADKADQMEVARP
jgi:hypothetical protein